MKKKKKKKRKKKERKHQLQQQLQFQPSHTSTCYDVCNLHIDNQLSHFVVYASSSRRRYNYRWNEYGQSDVERLKTAMRSQGNLGNNDTNTTTNTSTNGINYRNDYFIENDEQNLVFYYRVLRRFKNMQNCNPELLGPNGEFLIRFRVSALTSPLIIRLSNSPHEYLYQIKICPNWDHTNIKEVILRMEEHKKEESFSLHRLDYDNHHGLWFTLHVSKSRFYLFCHYLECMEDSFELLRQRESIPQIPTLLCYKRVKMQNIYWIGFASLTSTITISTPDIDASILTSWLQWLILTGIETKEILKHEYEESKSQKEDDYDNNDKNDKTKNVKKKSAKQLNDEAITKVRTDIKAKTILHAASLVPGLNDNLLMNDTKQEVDSKENENQQHNIWALI